MQDAISYVIIRLKVFGQGHTMLKYLIPVFASISFLSANSLSIGLVRSSGEFRLDGLAVSGNGTVFEGTLVETASTRSFIQLSDAQMTLSPDSSARVYRDRIVLEKGSGSVKDGAHYVIEADTMRIVPSTQESVVQIEIASPSRLTVSAHGGAAEVSNSAGILTARLRPGMALAFNPQAAPDSSVRMIGVVESRGASYFLTDETTKVTVQLVENSDVSKYVGKKVEIAGSAIPAATLTAGASQLIRVVTITPFTGKREVGAIAAGTGGAATGGATAGGGAAAGGAAGGAAAGGAAAGVAAAGVAAGAGLSAAAIGAIVGGVAVVGTVGGLAATGTFSSSSSVSRP
jgi:hypothetical protein